MLFLKICFWTVVVIVAFVAVLDLGLCIWGYSIYRKRTLDHTYQKLNAKVFMSTYHLFPHRYDYSKPMDESLTWVTYTVITPGSNKFYPNKTEYYILFNFADYCKVNIFLTKEESAQKRKQVSERETNIVLEDLQKLTREEIEKADREIDNAIAGVKKHMTNN